MEIPSVGEGMPQVDKLPAEMPLEESGLSSDAMKAELMGQFRDVQQLGHQVLQPSDISLHKV